MNLLPTEADWAAARETRSTRRTVTRLLDAAMGVFAERGYAASRVDDIAQAAGTSHGTFYLYFANKRAVFVALSRRLADELGTLALELASGEAHEDVPAMRAWLARFTESYARNWPVIRAWTDGDVTDDELVELAAGVRDRVTIAVASRIAVVNPDVDPTTAATALFAMVERFHYDALMRGQVPDSEALDTLAAVAHAGFFRGRVPVAVS